MACGATPVGSAIAVIVADRRASAGTLQRESELGDAAARARSAIALCRAIDAV